MRNANAPAGPGNPLNERREAVAEQEEIDELQADLSGDAPVVDDAAENARHADRNARGKFERKTRDTGNGGAS